MMCNEACTTHHRRIGLHKWRRIFAGNETVGDGLAQTVLSARIDNSPEASRTGVDRTTGLQLCD